MDGLIYKFFGIDPIDTTRLVGWPSITFSNLKTPFAKLIFLLAAAGAAYIIWWFYKREPDYCSIRKRRWMAAFRFSGVATLLFILSGPVLEVFLKGFITGRVVVLVDNSKSMERQDKYRRPEDKLVAAHVLGDVPLKDTDLNKVTGAAERNLASSNRMTLVQKMLEHKDIQLLQKLQEKYAVEMWTFSRASEMDRLAETAGKVTPDALKDVKTEGTVTEIGNALRKTIDRLKGQPLLGIVLVTDGANNKGEDPAIVAQDSPARIFPIGIGVPESQNAAVTHVFMDSKIFVDDLAPMHVRIKHHGFANEQAKLVVSCDNEEIGQQAVTLRESGEQNEILRVKPRKAGRYTYRVEIKLVNAAAEDIEPNDNFKTREVEVIDQKLNVLIVEADPRWEYRFLKNSLLRDKRVNCKILLRVPDMAELARSSQVYLREFPNREDLFKYHLIVFGNMPNDGFFTEHDFDNLRRFVIEEGGGIWFIAGKNNLPDAYKDSKLELLFPIEYEQNASVSPDDEQTNPITDPFRPVLTAEGRTHSVTRLEAGSSENSDEQNASLWELVPEMYWHHKALRPKLGATTLLTSGASKENTREPPAPLLVTSQIGRGRVLYQGFSDLWRMRFPAELGPDALERFHGHVAQYLGLTKLLGRTARVEISLDREEYSIGDRIKVTARVLTKKDLEYSSADHEVATVAGLDPENESSQTEVQLTPEPGQRGVFHGELSAAQTGKFRVSLKDEEDDQAHADFGVIIPQLESESPDMKKDLLDAIAKNSARGAGSAGRMYLADQAAEVLKDISQAQKPVDPQRHENALWSSPFLLFLFTLFMGAEWLLRKRNDLL